MPELPPSKKRPPLVPRLRPQPIQPELNNPAASEATLCSANCPVKTTPSYAELHCKTNFSFLEGASHPDELVARAAELGYRALAITDRNSLAGVVRAHGAAKQVGLPLVIGAELTPREAPPLLAWPKDRAAYGRLARLITLGRRRAPKGQFHLEVADLASASEGLLAGALLADPDPESPAQLEALGRYREIFGAGCYLVAEISLGPSDASRLDRFTALARRVNMPLVAAGDVHYHCRARLPLQDTLTAIRLGQTIDTVGAALFPNGERYLKSPAEMARRFARAPRRWLIRSTSPPKSISRSTNCAMNIPRSSPRRAKRHSTISVGSLGKAPRGGIRRAFRPKSKGSSSTSWR